MRPQAKKDINLYCIIAGYLETNILNLKLILWFFSGVEAVQLRHVRAGAQLGHHQRLLAPREAALARSQLHARGRRRQRHDQDQCAWHQGGVQVSFYSHCSETSTNVRQTQGVLFAAFAARLLTLEVSFKMGEGFAKAWYCQILYSKSSKYATSKYKIEVFAIELETQVTVLFKKVISITPIRKFEIK